MSTDLNIKKQSSRKGKKSWRTNIDIKDIEDKLQEQRDEEIIKGKDNDDDFIIDEKPSSNIKVPKKLKSHEILTNKSKIPALLNPKQSKKSNKVQGVSKTELLKLIKLKGGKYGEENKLMNKIEKDGLISGSNIDLWDEPTKEENGKWINYPQSTAEVTKATRAPKTFKTAPVKIVSNDLTEKFIHAGKSYNPSLESWKELIDKEYNIEYKRELARQQIEDFQKRIQELVITLKDGMLSDSEDEDEGEEEKEEEEEITDFKLSINKPTKVKIKTKTKRNKEAKHKKRMELEKDIKDLKKQLKDLHNLDDILKALQEEEDSKQPKSKKRKLKDNKLFKYELIETPLEIKLSSELTNNLKNLKPEGNLFYDQMLNLQSTGKVESRIPVSKKRKYGKKVTEKWSYKDFK
ncbi:unnamed protein product [Candida verbasci]|uniref:Ribosome biogenesis protein NOP53 n=1 Tax=Candida verbasci TaxID=1227364 RepID=A0A9W4TTR4_9ASCO|nr:unnamed protein product [Candida verbasci]